MSIKIRVQHEARSLVLDVNPGDPLSSILEKTNDFFHIPPESQEFFHRSGVKLNLLDNNRTFADNNIKSRETLILKSTEVKDEDNLYEREDQKRKKIVIEDKIDAELENIDGWTEVGRTRYCNHSDNGKCTHCMSIAPWNVHLIEKYKDVKHIPFHSYLRHKKYNSPTNPIYLEDTNYAIKYDYEVSAKETFSISLERQPFRHVDNVVFESKDMVAKFIAKWQTTFQQRCGYLVGRYRHDPNYIPLNITAVVCAIYEPPQMDVDGLPKLLKDENEEKVDEFCKSKGLERIGYIWTSIKANDYGIPMKDDRDFALTSYECMKSSLLQAKYPSPSRHSDTGKYGSKFVSVIIKGGDDGEISIDAYQISNQVTNLIRDRVVKVSEKEDSLTVRKSKNGKIYPDVYYVHKNEYGLDEKKKADPDFPNSYAIVSLTHSTPLEPKYTFKDGQFEKELKEYIRNG